MVSLSATKLFHLESTTMAATTTSSSTPVNLQLWIVSKSGGLIYQSAPPTATSSSFRPVSSNEALIFAGTLHGIHAITARLDPTNDGRPNRNLAISSAMESLEAEGFGIAIKATQTGVKLLLLHPSAGSSNPQAVLQRCYESYADKVMRNPFYTMEMPIRIEAFDRDVGKILAGS